MVLSGCQILIGELSKSGITVPSGSASKGITSPVAVTPQPTNG